MTARLYTAEETALIREKIINHYALPIVKRVFAKYLQIQSAYFAVAQYWSDEARDEVHDFFLYSELAITSWSAFAEAEWLKDEVNLPGFKNEYSEFISQHGELLDGIWEELQKEPSFHSWDDFCEDEIAAFAAFCKEGSSQDMHSSKNYIPYALFTRTDTEIKIKIVGKMLRPWLDGIRPEADY